MDAHFHLEGCDFVWDTDKAEATFRKRGIRFEDAATVFFDPLLVLMDATRNQQPRDAVIGLDRHARLLFVVHLEMHDETIRIISARAAEHWEESLYAE